MKWHETHTTWFFETFVLHPFLDEVLTFRAHVDEAMKGSSQVRRSGLGT
jgi:hypothetical protein